MSSMSNPNDGVSYQEHWQTWTVSHGYYGLVDPARTNWAIEWASKELANECWRRRDEITRIVERHEPTRKQARLRVRKLDDGTLEISEYDWGRWSDTLPSEGAAA